MNFIFYVSIKNIEKIANINFILPPHQYSEDYWIIYTLLSTKEKENVFFEITYVNGRSNE
jgi:hypothetical protein